MISQVVFSHICKSIPTVAPAETDFSSLWADPTLLDLVLYDSFISRREELIEIGNFVPLDSL